MIVFVNTAACGGTGLDRWSAVSDRIRARSGPFAVRITPSVQDLRRGVLEAWQAGERHFVAAGGDGTVNALAHALMVLLPPGERSQATIGAVGLGSSNDFHKPRGRRPVFSGVPVTLDPASARPRDVGLLACGEQGVQEERIFLVNASAGITAAANRFFNEPGRILSSLKRIWTGGAILYAALATIFSFRDLALRVRTDSGDEHPMQVTNAAILKNPHVSGNLRFPGEPAYDSGTFRFHVASRLGVPGRIRLLVSLMRGRLWCDRRLEAFEGHCAELRSATPFDVECDGEVIRTSAARFSIAPQALRVCTC